VCESDFYFLYMMGYLQKTTQGQEVHKFYPFQPLFLAYWEFQKYQSKVAIFAPRLGGPKAECF